MSVLERKKANHNNRYGEAVVIEDGDRSFEVSVDRMLFQPAMNNQGLWYPQAVAGIRQPSNMSYYSAEGYPSTCYSEEKTCWQVCVAMTAAYGAAIHKTQQDIREAIGL